MNILIIYDIKKEDIVTDRIVRGFLCLECNVDYITEYNNIPDKYYDIVFIDPGLTFNPINKLKYNILMFFDCHDSADDFEPNTAYYELKDKVLAYAKISWKKENNRNDNILNIGLPLPQLSLLKNIANQQIEIFSYKNAIPLFIGSPTMLSQYQLVKNRIYFEDKIRNIKSIIPNPDMSELFIYNQRIEWLLILQDANIFHYGGLNYWGDPDFYLSLPFQQKYFGENIKYLSTKRLSPIEHLKLCFTCRIGLSPSGNCRVCYRLLDYMAAGSIIFTTDLQGANIFPMPKYYVTVYDDENIADVLLYYQKQYKELWKMSQENRKLIGMSNENLIKLFQTQYQ